MDSLRNLILERVMAKGGGAGAPWVLDVYDYLIERGISSDDAIRAMSQFVDEYTSLRSSSRKAFK
jgi:hypothetical protein